MSFSRRYAKERSRPLPEPEDDGIQEEADESILAPPEAPSEPAPRKLRFLGRTKAREEKAQQEEAFKRRFTHQASRLNAPPAHEENHSGRAWQSFFWSVLFIFLFCIAAVGWHYSDQWIFPIKHVDVKGDFKRVDPLALQGVLSHYATGSLMFFSASELEQQLQDLPWVDHVSLHRQWPTTLEVGIFQKQPVARYGDGDLIGMRGELFSVPSLSGFENLPTINGPEDRAAQLWQMYQSMNQTLEPYQLRVWQLSVSPRLAYTVVLSNGITLYLGSTDILQRLTLFTKVYEKTLKQKADEMQYADLRYNSGVAIGWKSKAASTSRAVKDATRKSKG